MKILLVSGPGISLKEPFDSGIESFMVSFARALVEMGHDVDVIAAKAETDAPFLLINPFVSSKTDHPGFFRRMKENRQFRNLDTKKYDLVHYNMFYPHLIKAGRKFKKPSLITLHSPADKLRASVYKKASQEGSMTFVAISERVKKQWDQALNQNTYLINNGINTHLWPKRNSAAGKYLLWSARINKNKNVADAIKLAMHIGLPLKIAGRIVDQTYFDEEVKPHLNNQIQYVGHLTQRELSLLTKDASAYIATATWQEPFGLAALEMLCSGVPVVGYSTAVPPNWSDESVLTCVSHRWQDLITLLEKSKTVSPDTCHTFASSMGIKQMTEQYTELYQRLSSAYDDNNIQNN